MRPIPPKLREQMERDPFMRKCCLSDGNCSGRVEWHHALIFAGKQHSEAFAIVPACKEYHHRYADRKDIRERFLEVVVRRATYEELEKISKVVDYVSLKKKYEARENKKKV